MKPNYWTPQRRAEMSRKMKSKWQAKEKQFASRVKVRDENFLRDTFPRPEKRQESFTKRPSVAEIIGAAKVLLQVAANEISRPQKF